jgi:hypothetical protein
LRGHKWRMVKLLSQPGRERQQRRGCFIRFSPQQHVAGALNLDVRFKDGKASIPNILRSKHRGNRVERPSAGHRTPARGKVRHGGWTPTVPNSDTNRREC